MEETGNPSLRSGARLLVGTLHDNALLLTRSLCLESFASPLTLRTRTLSSGRGTVGPLQVGTGCTSPLVYDSISTASHEGLAVVFSDRVRTRAAS